jgi:hypothetical protein
MWCLVGKVSSGVGRGDAVHNRKQLLENCGRARIAEGRERVLEGILFQI